MNKKRYSSLRSIVKTWMNAAARLRHAENVLKGAEDVSSELFSSFDQERYRILSEELRILVEDAGIPSEIERVEEVVAYLLRDCEFCSGADDNASEREDTQKDVESKACGIQEESDDWVEFAKKPVIPKKAAAIPRATEGGIRRLVIRKSPRTQK